MFDRYATLSCISLSEVLLLVAVRETCSQREWMAMPDLVIERDILIEAPAEVVWRTITEPDQMSLWFADRVDLVVEPGAHGYMQFGDQGGPVVVQTVEPPSRFSFRWNHARGE